MFGGIFNGKQAEELQTKYLKKLKKKYMKKMGETSFWTSDAIPGQISRWNLAEFLEKKK